MRLIHFKIVNEIDTVTSEHNHIIGGNGAISANGLDLVIRKLSSDYHVLERNIIIANIMNILEVEDGSS
jgi:hypothetical protein